MERAILEFVARLRRAGVRVSPAEAVDAVRAACAVDVTRREELRLALLVSLAKDAEARGRVLATFEDFFSATGTAPTDLYGRLSAQGFTDAELACLRAILEPTARSSPAGNVLWALTEGEAAISHWLERTVRGLNVPRQTDRSQLGFWTMRVLSAARVPRAETDLAGVRMALRGALGERGDSLGDALSEALGDVSRLARQQLRLALSTSVHPSLRDRPFATLTAREILQMDAHVSALAQRLLGRAAVRKRRRQRGRLHAPRTLRSALRTAGVPVKLVFRRAPERRPHLLVLCDVSDSMHNTARFMLLLVHALQRLFAETRSFVFVSEVAEATQVFKREGKLRAVELAYRGGIVSVADNSNYARVFAQLRARHLHAFSHNTTLLVLGDGRSNHLAAGERDFSALAERVKRVLWFTPELDGQQASGDSALSRYMPSVTQLCSVYDLKSLAQAARILKSGHTIGRNNRPRAAL